MCSCGESCTLRIHVTRAPRCPTSSHAHCTQFATLRLKTHFLARKTLANVAACRPKRPHPPRYGPPKPWPRERRPTIRLCKAACLPKLPLSPHLIKFLANTMQINTSCKCKDYDSINQHSHQSTRATGPQGGRVANHDHAQGGRSDAGAYIYI